VPASLTHGVIHRPPPRPIEPGWGGDGSPEQRGSSRRTAFFGLLLLVVATAIVFAAFTIAFVMRRSLSGDWAHTPKPPILWVNTALLLVSSFVLDRARHALKAGDRSRFNFWWTSATALGILFLLGQAIAWSQLWSRGIYMASSPGSAFFFVLTAAHAFHLLGGVAALAYVDVQALRLRLGPAKRTTIDVAAIYWHFLDGVWLYLMALFYFWG
jgi:cytochrome c oxidase subunit 3